MSCNSLNLSQEVPFSDILLYQGSQWRKTFKLKDKSGVIVNLTGVSIVGVVKQTKEGSVIFSFDVSINTTTNEFTMAIDYTDTLAITTLTSNLSDAANQFVFDWTLTDSLSEQYKIHNGRILINKKV